MSKLKPCPFCGGEARISTEYDMDGFGTFHQVKCTQCGASSRQHFCSHGNEDPQYYSEVREDWQERVDSEGVAQLKADNAKLLSSLEKMMSAIKLISHEFAFTRSLEECNNGYEEATKLLEDSHNEL